MSISGPRFPEGDLAVKEPHAAGFSPLEVRPPVGKFTSLDILLHLSFAPVEREAERGHQSRDLFIFPHRLRL